MFRKKKLERQIKSFRKKIEAVEKKRTRSQAALIEAILTQTTPDDNDVDYFNKYTAEINELRDRMHELQMIINKM